MLTVTGIIACAENERLLRSIRWPFGLVVEPGRIPNDLQHYLWNLDGVCGRAVAADTGSGKGRGPVLGISDMALVIWRVQVDSIPATVGVELKLG